MSATLDDVLAAITAAGATLQRIEDTQYQGELPTNADIMAKLTDIETLLSNISAPGEGTPVDITGLLQEISDKLTLLEAEALGSWMLDKATNILTVYDLTGEEVAKFHVTDTVETASKERRMDLEV